MKKERKFFSLFYYKRHKKEIRNYCIGDCILTAELSVKWVDTFYGMFGFYPQNWISSGYVAEKVLTYNGTEMPFFHDFEYPIQELARAAFVGGRFELIQTRHQLRIPKCVKVDAGLSQGKMDKRR